MFISSKEFRDTPGLYPKVKSWAGHLNIAGKKSGMETFKISGPMVLNVRIRRPGAAVTKPQPHNFMGDEEFRISTVLLENKVERDGIEILVIFNPVSLTLASEVASLSLPLDKALEVFTGMEKWVEEIESAEKAREKEQVKAAVAHLPTVEETRASETWGAW